MEACRTEKVQVETKQKRSDNEQDVGSLSRLNSSIFVHFYFFKINGKKTQKIPEIHCLLVFS